MRFDGFPELQSLWDQYQGVSRAGIISGYLQLKRMEVKAVQTTRTANAVITQLENRRRVMNGILDGIRHQVEFQERMRELQLRDSMEYVGGPPERQREISGASASPAIGAAPPAIGAAPAPKRLPTPPPIVTIVTPQKIQEEAEAIASGYPGAEHPDEPVYVNGHMSRIERDYPPDAADKIFEAMTVRILEKEREKRKKGA